MLYACDHVWWRHYFPDVSRRFPGELWSVSEGAREEFGVRWVYGHPKAMGLSTAPGSINCGKNSGYQCLGLMHLFGVARVTLVGFDMMATDGRSHWHGDHPRGKLGNGGIKRFPAWRADMNAIAHDLKREGVIVVNASRRTALRCFPRVLLEDALCTS